ncbi:MAG: hypothetical protein ABW186_18450 [Rhodanobacteraceae bacterium]
MATRKKRAAAKKRPVRKAAPRKAAKKVAPKKAASKAPARKVAKRVAAKRPAAKSARVATKTAAGKPKVRTNRAASAGASREPRVATARRVAAPPSVDASLFPCGDAALRGATGKDWAEWLTLLDASGAAARKLDHTRMWELVMQSLPDSASWWGQMVAVGYERARGIRVKHESSSGKFQATLSKTFEVPLFAAFAAWADAALRENWLDAPGLDFTKLNMGRNIRARWPDGSVLDIRFNETGSGKCQIVVDTMKLADADAVQKAKAFWQSQFENLGQYLSV